MSRKSQYKASVFVSKITALFLIFFQLISASGAAETGSGPSGWSNPLVPIPENLGRSESFIPARKDKTILLIQDAHDSLEVQENIAKMIDDWVKRQGVKTVYEEGYEGPVPTDKYFEAIEDPGVKEKVSYYLMDKLRIGGAEFAHINRKKDQRPKKKIKDSSAFPHPKVFSLRSSVSGLDFQLIGVDSLKLHDENLEAYRRSHQFSAETLRGLHAIQFELERLAKMRFSKPFKIWLRHKKLFESGKLGLLEYVQRTEQLLEREGKDDKSSKKAPMNHVNFQGLLHKITVLEKRTEHRFLNSPDVRKIYGYITAVQLLERLQNIEVSSNEFEVAQKKLDLIDTEGLAQFLAGQSKMPVLLSKNWEKRILEAVRFYQTAKRRDKNMETYLDEFLENPSEKKAVLVFGGFHKDHILQILARKGISCQAVLPRMTTRSKRHEDYYRRLMNGGEHEFEGAERIAQSAKRKTQERPDSFAMRHALSAMRNKATRIQPIFRFSDSAIRAELNQIAEVASQLPKNIDGQIMIRQIDEAFRIQHTKIQRAEIRAQNEKKQDLPNVLELMRTKVNQLNRPVYIFIHGDAGVGKSTFADRLVSALPNEAVKFDIDDIVSGKDLHYRHDFFENIRKSRGLEDYYDDLDSQPLEDSVAFGLGKKIEKALNNRELKFVIIEGYRLPIYATVLNTHYQIPLDIKILLTANDATRLANLRERAQKGVRKGTIHSLDTDRFDGYDFLLDTSREEFLPAKTEMPMPGTSLESEGPQTRDELRTQTGIENQVSSIAKELRKNLQIQYGFPVKPWETVVRRNGVLGIVIAGTLNRPEPWLKVRVYPVDREPLEVELSQEELFDQPSFPLTIVTDANEIHRFMKRIEDVGQKQMGKGTIPKTEIETWSQIKPMAELILQMSVDPNEMFISNRIRFDLTFLQRGVLPRGYSLDRSRLVLTPLVSAYEERTRQEYQFSNASTVERIMLWGLLKPWMNSYAMEWDSFRDAIYENSQQKKPRRKVEERLRSLLKNGRIQSEVWADLKRDLQDRGRRPMIVTKWMIDRTVRINQTLRVTTVMKWFRDAEPRVDMILQDLFPGIVRPKIPATRSELRRLENKKQVRPMKAKEKEALASKLLRKKDYRQASTTSDLQLKLRTELRLSEDKEEDVDEEDSNRDSRPSLKPVVIQHTHKLNETMFGVIRGKLAHLSSLSDHIRVTADTQDLTEFHRLDWKSTDVYDPTFTGGGKKIIFMMGTLDRALQWFSLGQDEPRLGYFEAEKDNGTITIVGFVPQSSVLIDAVAIEDVKSFWDVSKILMPSDLLVPTLREKSVDGNSKRIKIRAHSFMKDVGLLKPSMSDDSEFQLAFNLDNGALQMAWPEEEFKDVLTMPGYREQYLHGALGLPASVGLLLDDLPLDLIKNRMKIWNRVFEQSPLAQTHQFNLLQHLDLFRIPFEGQNFEGFSKNLAQSLEQGKEPFESLVRKALRERRITLQGELLTALPDPSVLYQRNLELELEQEKEQIKTNRWIKAIMAYEYESQGEAKRLENWEVFLKQIENLAILKPSQYRLKHAIRFPSHPVFVPHTKIQGQQWKGGNVGVLHLLPDGMKSRARIHQKILLDEINKGSVLTATLHLDHGEDDVYQLSIEIHSDGRKEPLIEGVIDQYGFTSTMTGERTTPILRKWLLSSSPRRTPSLRVAKKVTSLGEIQLFVYPAKGKRVTVRVPIEQAYQKTLEGLLRTFYFESLKKERKGLTVFLRPSGRPISTIFWNQKSKKFKERIGPVISDRGRIRENRLFDWSQNKFDVPSVQQERTVISHSMWPAIVLFGRVHGVLRGVVRAPHIRVGEKARVKAFRSWEDERRFEILTQGGKILTRFYDSQAGIVRNPRDEAIRRFESEDGGGRAPIMIPLYARDKTLLLSKKKWGKPISISLARRKKHVNDMNVFILFDPSEKEKRGVQIYEVNRERQPENRIWHGYLDTKRVKIVEYPKEYQSEDENDFDLYRAQLEAYRLKFTSMIPLRDHIDPKTIKRKLNHFKALNISHSSKFRAEARQVSSRLGLWHPFLPISREQKQIPEDLMRGGKKINADVFSDFPRSKHQLPSTKLQTLLPILQSWLITVLSWVEHTTNLNQIITREQRMPQDGLWGGAERKSQRQGMRQREFWRNPLGFYWQFLYEWFQTWIFSLSHLAQGRRSQAFQSRVARIETKIALKVASLYQRMSLTREWLNRKQLIPMPTFHPQLPRFKTSKNTRKWLAIAFMGLEYSPIFIYSQLLYLLKLKCIESLRRTELRSDGDDLGSRELSAPLTTANWVTIKAGESIRISEDIQLQYQVMLPPQSRKSKSKIVRRLPKGWSMLVNDFHMRKGMPPSRKSKSKMIRRLISIKTDDQAIHQSTKKKILLPERWNAFGGDFPVRKGTEFVIGNESNPAANLKIKFLELSNAKAGIAIHRPEHSNSDRTNRSETRATPSSLAWSYSLKSLQKAEMDRIGIPRNDSSSKRAPSPVTSASPLPAIKASNKKSSSGSRQTGSPKGVGVTNNASSWSQSSSSLISALSKLNLGRWRTSVSSAIWAGDMISRTVPLRINLPTGSRAGERRSRDTKRFVSRMILGTAITFLPYFLDDVRNFLIGERIVFKTPGKLFSQLIPAIFSGFLLQFLKDSDFLQAVQLSNQTPDSSDRIGFRIFHNEGDTILDFNRNQDQTFRTIFASFLPVQGRQAIDSGDRHLEDRPQTFRTELRTQETTQEKIKSFFTLLRITDSNKSRPTDQQTPLMITWARHLMDRGLLPDSFLSPENLKHPTSFPRSEMRENVTELPSKQVALRTAVDSPEARPELRRNEIRRMKIVEHSTKNIDQEPVLQVWQGDGWKWDGGTQRGILRSQNNVEPLLMSHQVPRDSLVIEHGPPYSGQIVDLGLDVSQQTAIPSSYFYRLLMSPDFTEENRDAYRMRRVKAFISQTADVIQHRISSDWPREVGAVVWHELYMYLQAAGQDRQTVLENSLKTVSEALMPGGVFLALEGDPNYLKQIQETVIRLNLPFDELHIYRPGPQYAGGLVFIKSLKESPQFRAEAADLLFMAEQLKNQNDEAGDFAREITRIAPSLLPAPIAAELDANSTVTEKKRDELRSPTSVDSKELRVRGQAPQDPLPFTPDSRLRSELRDVDPLLAKWGQGIGEIMKERFDRQTLKTKEWFKQVYQEAPDGFFKEELESVKTTIDGHELRIRPKTNLSSFEAMRVLGLYLLWKSKMATGETAHYQPADLRYLEQLIQDYNAQKQRGAKLDIPSLFYYSRSHYFKSNETFKDFALEIKNLPSPYVRKAVGLHNFMQGAHLDGFGKLDTFYELEIAAEFMEFSFRELRKKDLPQDEREALETGLARLLNFLLPFMSGHIINPQEPFDSLQIFDETPDVLIGRLYQIVGGNLDLIVPILQTVRDIAPLPQNPHIPSFDRRQHDPLLTGFLWYYYIEDEPYLLGRDPGPYSIEELFLHPNDEARNAYLNQKLHHVMEKIKEHFRRNKPSQPKIIFYGQQCLRIGQILNEVIPDLGTRIRDRNWAQEVLNPPLIVAPFQQSAIQLFRDMGVQQVKIEPDGKMLNFPEDARRDLDRLLRLVNQGAIYDAVIDKLSKTAYISPSRLELRSGEDADDEVRNISKRIRIIQPDYSVEYGGGRATIDFRGFDMPTEWARYFAKDNVPNNWTFYLHLMSHHWEPETILNHPSQLTSQDFKKVREMVATQNEDKLIQEFEGAEEWYRWFSDRMGYERYYNFVADFFMFTRFLLAVKKNSQDELRNAEYVKPHARSVQPLEENTVIVFEENELLYKPAQSTKFRIQMGQDGKYWVIEDRTDGSSEIMGTPLTESLTNYTTSESQTVRLGIVRSDNQGGVEDQLVIENGDSDPVFLIRSLSRAEARSTLKNVQSSREAKMKDAFLAKTVNDIDRGGFLYHLTSQELYDFYIRWWGLQPPAKIGISHYSGEWKSNPKRVYLASDINMAYINSGVTFLNVPNEMILLKIGDLDPTFLRADEDWLLDATYLNELGAKYKSGLISETELQMDLQSELKQIPGYSQLYEEILQRLQQDTFESYSPDDSLLYRRTIGYEGSIDRNQLIDALPFTNEELATAVGYPGNGRYLYSLLVNLDILSSSLEEHIQRIRHHRLYLGPRTVMPKHAIASNLSTEELDLAEKLSWAREEQILRNSLEARGFRAKNDAGMILLGDRLVHSYRDSDSVRSEMRERLPKVRRSLAVIKQIGKELAVEKESVVKISEEIEKRKGEDLKTRFNEDASGAAHSYPSHESATRNKQPSGPAFHKQSIGDPSVLTPFIRNDKNENNQDAIDHTARQKKTQTNFLFSKQVPQDQSTEHNRAGIDHELFKSFQLMLGKVSHKWGPLMTSRIEYLSIIINKFIKIYHFILKYLSGVTGRGWLKMPWMVRELTRSEMRTSDEFQIRMNLKYEQWLKSQAKAFLKTEKRFSSPTRRFGEGEIQDFLRFLREQTVSVQMQRNLLEFLKTLYADVRDENFEAQIQDQPPHIRLLIQTAMDLNQQTSRPADSQTSFLGPISRRTFGRLLGAAAAFLAAGPLGVGAEIVSPILLRDLDLVRKIRADLIKSLSHHAFAQMRRHALYLLFPRISNVLNQVSASSQSNAAIFYYDSKHPGLGSMQMNIAEHFAMRYSKQTFNQAISRWIEENVSLIGTLWDELNLEYERLSVSDLKKRLDHPQKRYEIVQKIHSAMSLKDPRFQSLQNLFASADGFEESLAEWILGLNPEETFWLGRLLEKKLGIDFDAQGAMLNDELQKIHKFLESKVKPIEEDLRTVRSQIETREQYWDRQDELDLLRWADESHQDGLDLELAALLQKEKELEASLAHLKHLIQLLPKADPIQVALRDRGPIVSPEIPNRNLIVLGAAGLALVLAARRAEMRIRANFPMPSENGGPEGRLFGFKWTKRMVQNLSIAAILAVAAAVYSAYWMMRGIYEIPGGNDKTFNLIYNLDRLKGNLQVILTQGWFLKSRAELRFKLQEEAGEQEWALKGQLKIGPQQVLLKIGSENFNGNDGGVFSQKNSHKQRLKESIKQSPLMYTSLQLSAWFTFLLLGGVNPTQLKIIREFLRQAIFLYEEDTVQRSRKQARQQSLLLLHPLWTLPGILGGVGLRAQTCLESIINIHKNQYLFNLIINKLIFSVIDSLSTQRLERTEVGLGSMSEQARRVERTELRSDFFSKGSDKNGTYIITHSRPDRRIYLRDQVRNLFKSQDIADQLNQIPELNARGTFSPNAFRGCLHFDDLAGQRHIVEYFLPSNFLMQLEKLLEFHSRPELRINGSDMEITAAKQNGRKVPGRILAREIFITLVLGALFFSFNHYVYLSYVKEWIDQSLLHFIMGAMPVSILGSLLGGVAGERIRLYIQDRHLKKTERRFDWPVIKRQIQSGIFYAIPVYGFFVYGWAMRYLAETGVWQGVLHFLYEGGLRFLYRDPSVWTAVFQALLNQLILSPLLFDPMNYFVGKIVVDGRDFKTAVEHAKENLLDFYVIAFIIWAPAVFVAMLSPSPVVTSLILNSVGFVWKVVLIIVIRMKKIGFMAALQNLLHKFLPNLIPKYLPHDTAKAKPRFWFFRFLNHYYSQHWLGKFVLSSLFGLFLGAISLMLYLYEPHLGIVTPFIFAIGIRAWMQVIDKPLENSKFFVRMPSFARAELRAWESFETQKARKAIWPNDVRAELRIESSDVALVKPIDFAKTENMSDTFKLDGIQRRSEMRLPTYVDSTSKHFGTWRSEIRSHGLVLHQPDDLKGSLEKLSQIQYRQSEKEIRKALRSLRKSDGPEMPREALVSRLQRHESLISEGPEDLRQVETPWGKVDLTRLNDLSRYEGKMKSYELARDLELAYHLGLIRISNMKQGMSAGVLGRVLRKTLGTNQITTNISWMTSLRLEKEIRRLESGIWESEDRKTIIAYREVDEIPEFTVNGKVIDNPDDVQIIFLLAHPDVVHFGSAFSVLPGELKNTKERKGKFNWSVMSENRDVILATRTGIILLLDSISFQKPELRTELRSNLFDLSTARALPNEVRAELRIESSDAASMNRQVDIALPDMKITSRTSVRNEMRTEPHAEVQEINYQGRLFRYEKFQNGDAQIVKKWADGEWRVLRDGREIFIRKIEHSQGPFEVFRTGGSLILKKGGRAVGFLYFWFQNQEHSQENPELIQALLGGILIDNNFARQGLATSLLDEYFRYVINQGITNFEYTNEVHYPERLVHLSRYGFEPAPDYLVHLESSHDEMIIKQGMRDLVYIDLNPEGKTALYFPQTDVRDWFIRELEYNGANPKDYIFGVEPLPGSKPYLIHCPYRLKAEKKSALIQKFRKPVVRAASSHIEAGIPQSLFGREKVFIERQGSLLTRLYPKLDDDAKKIMLNPNFACVLLGIKSFYSPKTPEQLRHLNSFFKTFRQLGLEAQTEYDFLIVGNNVFIPALVVKRLLSQQAQILFDFGILGPSDQNHLLGLAQGLAAAQTAHFQEGIQQVHRVLQEFIPIIFQRVESDSFRLKIWTQFLEGIPLENIAYFTTVSGMESEVGTRYRGIELVTDRSPQGIRFLQRAVSALDYFYLNLNNQQDVYLHAKDYFHEERMPEALRHRLIPPVKDQSGVVKQKLDKPLQNELPQDRLSILKTTLEKHGVRLLSSAALQKMGRELFKNKALLQPGHIRQMFVQGQIRIPSAGMLETIARELNQKLDRSEIRKQSQGSATGQIVLIDFKDLSERFSDEQIKEVFYTAIRVKKGSRVMIYDVDQTEVFGKWLEAIKRRTGGLELGGLDLETGSLETVLPKYKGYSGTVIHLSAWDSEITERELTKLLHQNGIHSSVASSLAYRDKQSGTLGLGLKVLQDLQNGLLGKALPEFMARDPNSGRIYVTDPSMLKSYQVQYFESLAFSRAA